MTYTPTFIDPVTGEGVFASSAARYDGGYMQNSLNAVLNGDHQALGASRAHATSNRPAACQQRHDQRPELALRRAARALGTRQGRHPTDRIVQRRRKSELPTPIPKPKKQTGSNGIMLRKDIHGVFDEGFASSAPDASIAARAEFEYLYDKPYEDRKRIRVAGPFTVESLSPHRAAAVGVNGELIDELDAARGLHGREAEAESYVEAILENLRRAGVHQKDKDDRIEFTSLKPWPGELICAEGRYPEGDTERRAGIFIGPEYGTVQRADLVAAAREAAEAGFDLVIACAFNFDAHASEFHRLGRVPCLQARMNPDLHMADDLKAGGGNLFTIFGEPDIAIHDEATPSASSSAASTSSSPPSAASTRPTPTRSPAGSSTPTTTRSPSSSATPTSPPPTSPTRRSAPP